jgi:hypothetical protein
MTIAKIAYLTSPSPHRYILNIQKFGSDALEQIEISEGHLANIIADGAHHAFRKQCNRVPSTSNLETADGAGA